MLEIKELLLHQGTFTLGPLSLEVPECSYFVILGQTGSGKTMLLESIAGLQQIEGSISLDREEMTRLPPEQRGFGFVYQDFALFPNMSVQENILFAPSFREIEDIETLFEDVTAFLGIKDILQRSIIHLSGGEKQRVAIARAICSRPKLLLLDEPLSAVDPTFRTAIMIALKQIVSRYGISIIHVTHNFREATFLADHIAIMMDGKIVQSGDAEMVLHHPMTLEVAKFLGFRNILPGSLLGKSPRRLFSVNPNAVLFSRTRQDREYCIESKIEEIVIQADLNKVIVTSDGYKLYAKVPKNMFEKLHLQTGEALYTCMANKDVVWLPEAIDTGAINEK